MNKQHLLSLLAAALLAAAAPAAPAAAADAKPVAAQPARAAVRVEVKVILATTTAAAADPNLAANAAQLTKQFPQFKGFSQLKQEVRTLQLGQPMSLPLPVQDSTLGLTLLDASGGKFKLRMALPGGSAETTSADQGVFYVGGLPYNGGTLILAIKTVAAR